MIKDFFSKLFNLDKIKEKDQKIVDLNTVNSQLNIGLNELKIQNDSLKSQIETIPVLQTELNELFTKYKELQKTKNRNPVDLWCESKGYRIEEFGYRDKIFIKDKAIACDLRELITPNSYVVREARKSIGFTQGNSYENYLEVMRFIHRIGTWTDDGRQDNYFYPNYSLTVKKFDCEDGAFVQASILPELGVAFGFWKRSDGSIIGHAFAVGIYENNLYVFDWIPNKVMQYNAVEYYIHYIVTQNQVYVVDGSVDFGSILYG